MVSLEERNISLFLSLEIAAFARIIMVLFGMAASQFAGTGYLHFFGHRLLGLLFHNIQIIYWRVSARLQGIRARVTSNGFQGNNPVSRRF